MLVLSRRIEEKIVLPGLGVTLQVLSIKGNTVRLGIDAPLDVKVLREELLSQTEAAPQLSRAGLKGISRFGERGA